MLLCDNWLLQFFQLWVSCQAWLPAYLPGNVELKSSTYFLTLA